MTEQFSLITTQTKNGQTIYLGEQGNSFGWVFDYNNALWFNTNEEAKRFATDYFKNFKNWKVKEIDCILYWERNGKKMELENIKRIIEALEKDGFDIFHTKGNDADSVKVYEDEKQVIYINYNYSYIDIINK